MNKKKKGAIFRLPPTLSAKGLLPFAIVFFIVLALLTSQFFFKYSSDVFGKGIDNSAIAQLIISAMGSFLHMALPYPVIIASALLYRRLFRENKQLLASFRRDVVVVVSFSILVWFFAAFIKPNVNLNLRSLLWDIAMTSPEREFKRTDASFFRGRATTENIFGIVTVNDTLHVKIVRSRETLKKSLKSYVSPERLDSLLANTDLSEIGLTANEIKTYNAEWDGYHYPTKNLMAAIARTEMEIKSLKIKVSRNNREIWTMFVLPLSLLLLFVLCVQLGIINHKTNLLFLILSLTFFVVPVWYMLTYCADYFIATETISIAAGNLGLLAILLLCNLGFYSWTRKAITAHS